MFFIRLFSRLPFPVLYLISSVLAFIAYRIIGYRKAVVRENLRKSFPDKSDQEIKLIMKKFYRNLADILVETVKALTITKQEIYNRVSFTNADVASGELSNGRSIIVMTTHTGNWEWLLLGSQVHLKATIDAVYARLSNAFSEKFMREVRARFGSTPVEKGSVIRVLPQHRKEARILALVADQSPGKDAQKFWTDFLHRKTAFLKGGETFARLLDCRVVFMGMARVKRGYYEVDIKLISDPPYARENDEIIEKFARLTEKHVQQYPDQWLWSHKRWKLPAPEENE